MAESFVILHRPLPVIKSFRPGCLIFSSIKTFAPNSAALPAAKRPAGPAPITIASKLFIRSKGTFLCDSEEREFKLFYCKPI